MTGPEFRLPELEEVQHSLETFELQSQIDSQGKLKQHVGPSDIAKLKEEGHRIINKWIQELICSHKLQIKAQKRML